MMSCSGYIWTILIFLAEELQFNVRKILGVCVFGIHKYIHLVRIRTLGEYV
jgi:hypothetical protein